MKANDWIIDTDELNIAALLDVEQPSILTYRRVRIAVHVDRAIDVNPYRINPSRIRGVDGIARSRRDLTLGGLKHIATRLSNLNGLGAVLLKRQHLGIHSVGHDLRLGTCHRWRCHERAGHGGDTQYARQHSAHPHLLLPHHSSPYPYAFAMFVIAWRRRSA